MVEARAVQVIPLVYDLILWSSAKVSAFPRKHRFTVGDRLAACQLDLLTLLLTAQFDRGGRRATLASANLELEKLRYLFRLSKDLHCLSLAEFEFAVTRVTEAGRMVGGWYRYAQTHAPPG